MNDDQLDDLKQFITATVSQTEARLGDRIDGVEQSVKGLEQKVGSLEQKVDDGFAGVGEAIEQLHTQIDETNSEVNLRLTNLEQQAA